MPKIVTPQVFIIAETMTADGLDGFLKAIGVPDNWSTDAFSPAEALIEVAGKSCYMSFDTSLNKNLTRTGTRANREYIQEQIIQKKHGSVLEHACVTFGLVNVSRVLTHELVRHRAGCAFSQVSGRYVRTDELSYFLPQVISNNPEAKAIFNDAFFTMEQLVKQLELIYGVDKLPFNIKKALTSAFRRIVGNGQANHIVFTANHRALRHIIEMRTSPGAEEEIRVVFGEVFSQLLARYPAIYGDYVVKNDEAGLAEVVFPVGRV